MILDFESFPTRFMQHWLLSYDLHQILRKMVMSKCLRQHLGFAEIDDKDVLKGILTILQVFEVSSKSGLIFGLSYFEDLLTVYLHVLFPFLKSSLKQKKIKGKFNWPVNFHCQNLKSKFLRIYYGEIKRFSEREYFLNSRHETSVDICKITSLWTNQVKVS